MEEMCCCYQYNYINGNNNNIKTDSVITAPISHSEENVVKSTDDRQRISRVQYC